MYHRGNIISQKQFKFSDIKEHHCLDNYDNTAKNIQGLKDAMYNVYPDFEIDEIVTILRFIVL